MENLFIALMALVGLGISAFVFFIIYYFFKSVLGARAKADKADGLLDNGSSADVTDKFGALVDRLEADRKVYYKKTKGLFKRAFFRSLIVIFLIFYTLGALLGESKTFDIAQIIGPLLISAMLSLIGAGIYALIKKGNNSDKFTSKLKKELVAEIVKAVNPDLTFYEEGIDMETFDNADIFPGGKHTQLTSEDRIEGVVDGSKVVIAECVKTGYKGVNRRSAEVKVGDISLGQIGGRTSRNNSSDGPTEYFRGLFLQMELKNMNETAPIRIVPVVNVKKDIKFGVSIAGKVGYVKENVDEIKFDLFPELQDKPYEIYCTSSQEASRLVTDKFIKVLDFIYDKYYKDRGLVDKNSMLSSLTESKRNIYISIKEGNLYVALAWNMDMFEPDAFIKKDLKESGIAQKIYNDIQLITQIIKEMSLFNKVAA